MLSTPSKKVVKPGGRGAEWGREEDDDKIASVHQPQKYDSSSKKVGKEYYPSRCKHTEREIAHPRPDPTRW